MNLRRLAKVHARAILEDSTAGFGRLVIVTDPAGVSEAVTGITADVAQRIDPDTGQAVSGRVASVAISIASLVSVGLEIPRGIADSASRPWRVTVDDTDYTALCGESTALCGEADAVCGGYVGLRSTPTEYKVAQSHPDRTLGVVTCMLEVYAT